MKMQPNYTRINHVKSQKDPNYMRRQKKISQIKNNKR